MPFKPMKKRDYLRWIHQYGWSLHKAGIDWTLRDEKDKRVCTIKVTHPGGEIIAHDVRKTERELKEKGLLK